jgi:hypothetical protein
MAFTTFLVVSDPLLVPLILRDPPFFPIILFLSTTLITGMTGITLQMQWPLTSQSHDSFLKESNWKKKYFHVYAQPLTC